jgi:dihydrofolate reductase
MRNVIYAINTTIDGFCDHDKFYPGNEIMDYYTRLMQEADTLVYGRKTYQLMFPFWPDVAKNPEENTRESVTFARALDAVGEVVVFSRSLENQEGEKPAIISSGLEEEILKLKNKPGKNILVHAGVTIAAQLASLNLIDEYRIVVAPVILGTGRRVFDGINIKEKLQLKLVDTVMFKSGAVVLQYLKE